MRLYLCLNIDRLLVACLYLYEMSLARPASTSKRPKSRLVRSMRILQPALSASSGKECSRLSRLGMLMRGSVCVRVSA